MLLFFDLGRKGAISYFGDAQFQKVEAFEISNRKQIDKIEKVFLWVKYLEKQFRKSDQIHDIGFFYPFGKNRRTIVALTMLMTSTILHFPRAKTHLILEWEAWKFCLQQKRIPMRKEKKALTISWAQKYLNSTQPLTDDQADAVLGGVFLLRTVFQKQQ